MILVHEHIGRIFPMNNFYPLFANRLNYWLLMVLVSAMDKQSFVDVLRLVSGGFSMV
jgi:hypothetical protein